MKNIIIVGGGAGGLELAVGLSKKLNKKHYSVTLVDKEKTHIWKPHLHEISAGRLVTSSEEASYLNLAYRFGFKFVWGEMIFLNKEEKQIVVKKQVNSKGEIIIPERVLGYDNLVIAIGSTSNDFETKGVKEYSYSLDDLPSARSFHKNMIEKFLKKSYSSNEEEKSLNITIIGGGATGVELAAELSQTSKYMSQISSSKNEQPTKIVIVNAAPGLLPGLSEKISIGAEYILKDMKVEVVNSAKVIEIKDGITVVEKNGNILNIPSDMQVWAAGVKSPEFLGKMGLESTKGNQLIVNGKLQTSDPSIFAIGDCASVKWIKAPKEGMSVPPRAQSAHQMSEYLIKNILKINNGDTVKDFEYKDFGSLISLGTSDTVGTLMGFLQGKSLFVEGKIAKMMYIHLYQHHQIKINGFIPAFFLMIGKLIQKRFKPTIKMH